VYDNDCKRYSDFLTRVYPRITLKHFDVDRFSKMNVKLATQVRCLINWINIGKYKRCLGSSKFTNYFQFFSHSMAREIEFYRVHVKVESLKNSYDTQVFTDRFNKLIK